MKIVILAVVSILDREVGRVVQKLKQKDMLENSIIVFFSDNGAPSIGLHSNAGSNYPLRGVSMSVTFIKSCNFMKNLKIAKEHPIQRWCTHTVTHLESFSEETWTSV